MSIHDDEIEYQQWREEKEDWEMMQDSGRYDIRVGDMVEWIDISGIDPPLCDSELKTPKEIAFVGRDGWVSFDKPDNPEIDTGDWHPRRFRVVERPNGSGLVYCYCHGQFVRLAGENEPDANDLDQVGLLQAEIAGLKQGIAKHNAQVAALNETIENLRVWRAETVFRHQQEVDGLKAKIADYVHVQEELKSTIRDYRQEATGNDIKNKYKAAIKTLRKLIQDAPELNMRNYSEDQVAELNHAVCQMACICDAVERS